MMVLLAEVGKQNTAFCGERQSGDEWCNKAENQDEGHRESVSHS